MSLLSSTTRSMKFAMVSRLTMTSFRRASAIRARWRKMYSRKSRRRLEGSARTCRGVDSTLIHLRDWPKLLSRSKDKAVCRLELELHLRVDADAFVARQVDVGGLAISHFERQAEVLARVPNDIGEPGLVLARLPGGEVAIERVINAVAPVRVQCLRANVVVHFQPSPAGAQGREGGRVD